MVYQFEIYERGRKKKYKFAVKPISRKTKNAEYFTTKKQAKKFQKIISPMVKTKVITLPVSGEIRRVK